MAGRLQTEELPWKCWSQEPWRIRLLTKFLEIRMKLLWITYLMLPSAKSRYLAFGATLHLKLKAAICDVVHSRGRDLQSVSVWGPSSVSQWGSNITHCSLHQAAECIVYLYSACFLHHSKRLVFDNFDIDIKWCSTIFRARPKRQVSLFLIVFNM